MIQLDLSFVWGHHVFEMIALCILPHLHIFLQMYHAGDVASSYDGNLMFFLSIYHYFGAPTGPAFVLKRGNDTRKCILKKVLLE